MKKKAHYKFFFEKAMVSHFPNNYTALIIETEELFLRFSADIEFASKSSNPIDRRLDFAAYFLAMIKVLENKGLLYEQIKDICLEITYDFVLPKSFLQRWIKRLPVKLIGFKVTNIFLNEFNKRIGKKGNPDGFRAEILTAKSETYNLGFGINIFECGICKLFQKHEAGKYVSILCEVDKITSGFAGLELIRSNTIANGADKCDFRYRKA